MKRALIILCQLLIGSCLLCQDIQFDMYFEDAKGNRDTITLGYDVRATGGIDSLFGEKNIIDEPYKEGLDVRITNEWVSRDREGKPGTFHTKKQIFFQDVTKQVIDIKSPYFPVSAQWDSSLFQSDSFYGTLFTSVNPGGWWDVGSPSDLWRVFLADTNTVTFTSNAVEFNRNYAYINEQNDTIPVYWFAFGPASIRVSTRSIQSHPAISVFPNPVTSHLTIQNESEEPFWEIQVYNELGQAIYNGHYTTTLNTQNWKPGFYALILKNKNGTLYHTMIIKN